MQKKGTVWHQTDSLHYRVLKRSFVEFEDEGIKWEISTVLLEKDNPASIGEVLAVFRDLIDDIKWLYETMIFKLNADLTRVTYDGGADSYGFYRSNSSEDIVKAHDQIVSLIVERKLTPVKDTQPNLQISPHIVKAMTEQDSDERVQEVREEG